MNYFYLPFINNLQILPLKEAAHLWFAGEHDLHKLPHHLLLVALRCGRVPFLQPQLSLAAEQQHETHLDTKQNRTNTPDQCFQSIAEAGLYYRIVLLDALNKPKSLKSIAQHSIACDFTESNGYLDHLKTYKQK